jgi:hypothetical protein
MPVITLSIPEELKKQMEESREINWSEIARVAIKTKIAQLKILKAISAKSKLTEKDALELGRKINKSLHQEFSEPPQGKTLWHH